MAVVDNNSTALANAALSARKANNSIIERGDLLCSSGKMVKAAGDSDGSKYRIARLPVNARILGIRLTHAACAGATSLDIGVYLPQGAVVLATALATGLSLAAARAIPTQVLWTGLTPDNEKRIWEVAAVAADPKGEYEVVLTLNTAGGNAVTVFVDIDWVY